VIGSSLRKVHQQSCLAETLVVQVHIQSSYVNIP
jgi:hypothetical protein